MKMVKTVTRRLRWLAIIAMCSNAGLSRAADQDDATYRALVQRVRGGDFSVDFQALRLACVKSSLCEPRGTKADLAAMTQAGDAHDNQKLVTIAENLVSRGFVNAEAHIALTTAYAELHNAAKSKFHLDVVTHLMRSILEDGKTTQTAYTVICDREEYETLIALGLPYVGSKYTFDLTL